MATPVVIGGDCLAVLRDMESESVHAIVTDPPYGLSQVDSVKLTTALTAWVNGDGDASDRERVPGGKGFMGKEWDAFVPPPAVWDECLRVLKPGGHMLVFAGSRTVDLMGLSIRLAGFEIRDTLQWLYGSGFPKSLDVSKSLDKLAGAEREVIGSKIGQPGYADTPTTGRMLPGQESGNASGYLDVTAPATDAAREWEGWGTALKPAAEPIILARKPLSSTVARNVLAHGVGGLNIDGCRVGSGAKKWETPRGGIWKTDSTATAKLVDSGTGRFPANVLLTHNPDCTDDACDEGCPVAELDAQSGVLTSGKPASGGHKRRDSLGGDNGDVSYGSRASEDAGVLYGDAGGASRFFPSFRYQAKAPKSERPKVDGVAHPTVKPVALMRWLVRLVTPPGGTVLDPFAGSGTTLQAAQEEGFESIGIERELDYVKLIEARLGMDNAA